MRWHSPCWNKKVLPEKTTVCATTVVILGALRGPITSPDRRYSNVGRLFGIHVEYKAVVGGLKTQAFKEVCWTMKPGFQMSPALALCHTDRVPY